MSIQKAREYLGTGYLEWILVVDGPGNLSNEIVTELTPDVCLQLPTRSGIATARSSALAAARGDYIFPLDADDLISPVGIESAIEVLDTTKIDWVALNRVLLDGNKTPHWHGYHNWTPGELSEAWSAPFPFHPNTVVVRRELALAVSGWPALRVNEDLLFVLLLSEIAAGKSISEVATHYRVWPGQEIAKNNYVRDKANSFSYIELVINAWRARLGRQPINAPNAGVAFGRVAAEYVEY